MYTKYLRRTRDEPMSVGPHDGLQIAGFPPHAACVHTIPVYTTYQYWKEFGYDHDYCAVGSPYIPGNVRPGARVARILCVSCLVVKIVQ